MIRPGLSKRSAAHRDVEDVDQHQPSAGARRQQSSQDSFESKRSSGVQEPLDAKSGSFMGAVFGFFGRIKKAVRAVIVGAAFAMVGLGVVAPLSDSVTEDPKAQVQAEYVQAGDYIVKPGESMSTIAQKQGVSLEALIAANPQIEDPALIHPNDRINLPDAEPEREHVVQSGDSMSAIAQKFGVSLPDLIAANPEVTDPTLIHPEQIIKVPARHVASNANVFFVSGVPVATTAPVATEAAPDPAASDAAATTVSAGSGNVSSAVATPAVSVAVVETPATAATVAEAEPVPEKESKRLAVRLIRQINKLTFGLLEDRDIDYENTWAVGPYGSATVELKGISNDSNRGNSERWAYEREQDELKKKTLWVRSEGALALEAERAKDQGSAEADFELSFNMTRPYSYKESEPTAAVAAVEAFAQNLYSLPANHQSALELDQGAEFELRGSLELSADREIKMGTLEAGADADAYLSVLKLEDDRVEVRYSRTIEVDAEFDAKDLRDGTVDLDIDLGAERRRMHTFELDLSTPEGRVAYDDVLSFKTSRAERFAKLKDNGVELKRENDVTVREMQAKLRHQPDAEQDSTFRFSAKHERDGDDKSLRLKAGADTTITPEGSSTETKLGLDVERFKGPEKKSSSVEADARVDRELSERTDLSSTYTAGFEKEVDTRWETETRTGKLGYRGALDTVIPDDGGEPVELGFKAGAQVDYRLVTPLDAPSDLPLTGSVMRKASEGTRLTLSGQGSLGFDGQRDRADTELAAELELSGAMEIRATRLEDDSVRVRVSIDREIEAEASVDWEQNKDDAEYSASFKHEMDREHEMSGTFILNLAKPAHQAAYNALMKGDMAPASSLLNQDIPSWVKSKSNAQTFEFNAAPVEWLDAGLELSRRDIDPSNGMIRWNTERKAFSEAALADGSSVRWIQVDGALAPKLKHTGSIPVGGAVSSRYGVSWEKTLRYRMLAPSVDGQAVAQEPALTSQMVLGLARGSEFALEGRGELGGFTGLGFGTEWSTTGATASLVASADTKHSVGNSWKVEVLRLDDKNVKVSLQKGKDVSNAFEIAARAGVEIDAQELLDLKTEGDKLGVLKRATDILEKKIEDRLAFEFEASWDDRTDDSERLTLKLDLSKPAAATAYERLVKLDGKPAMDLLMQGSDAGVTLVSQSTSHTDLNLHHIHLQALGERLFLQNALRSDTTEITRWGDSGKRVDTSLYQKQREGLLGRESDMSWEAVRVRPVGDDVGRGFYRLQFEEEDPLTSKDEVKRLLSLADSLEAKPVRAVKVKEGARGVAKLLFDWAKHGETKLDMELFFTGRGIDEIRKFDGTQARMMYGKLTAEREGRDAFGWAHSVHGAEASALLDEYKELKDSPHQDKETNQQLRDLEVQYWRLTDNEMWDDKKVYWGARSFANMVDRMHNDSDPVTWNKAFADLGQAVGFDFYDAVSVMRQMAGSDEVLLHKLEMKGRAVDIEMKDQGLIERPA